MQQAIEKDCGEIGHEWNQVVNAFQSFSQVQCENGSCPCLDLEAALDVLMKAVTEQRPTLDNLIELKVHMVLPGYACKFPKCPHSDEARLAIAEAYYK